MNHVCAQLLNQDTVWFGALLGTILGMCIAAGIAILTINRN